MLVLPSVEDGFGIVICEAMAAGLPVIASRNTGGPDVIALGSPTVLIGGLPAALLLPPTIGTTTLRLAGEWNVDLGQRVDGRIRISRQSGDLILKEGGESYALGLERLDVSADFSGQQATLAVQGQGSKAGRGLGPGLEGLLEVPGGRVIHFEPSVTLALDESCRLQCRLSVETRTNAYQIRTGEFDEDQISVYFAVRQYWGTGPDRSFAESFRRQRAIGEELVQERIIPRIVRPLAQAIASR